MNINYKFIHLLIVSLNLGTNTQSEEGKTSGGGVASISTCVLS